MTFRAVLAPTVALLLAACSSTTAPVDLARAKDRDCVGAAGAAEVARSGSAWIVVQGGEVAGVAKTLDAALAAAASKPSRDAPHRFVYRGDDAGERLYRLTFVPPSGVVAGRRFLADLGWTFVSGGPRGSGKPLVLERKGRRRSFDLVSKPAVRVELRPAGGGSALALDVPIDPEFDGPLLLPAATAEPLALARAEIPGAAEVQVALGRPLGATRAWARASCADLDAQGTVEVLRASPPK